MNSFIEVINNKFVGDLYSDHDFIGAKLGYIKLDLSDQYEFTLHLKNRPKFNVTKWGRWGESYNVVVLRFISQGNSLVKMYKNGNSALLLDSVTIEKDICNLSFKFGEEYLLFSFDSIVFQGSSVYTE